MRLNLAIERTATRAAVLAAGLWSWPVASGQSDFPVVYGRMKAAIKGLGSFRVTVTENLHALKRCTTSVNHIEYRSDRMFRIETESSVQGWRRLRQVATRNGDLIVVAKKGKKQTVYMRYALARVPQAERPRFDVLRPLALPPIAEQDLERFELTGTATVDGEEVVQYVCPPREQEDARQCAIPGLTGSGAMATGKIVVWVSLTDFLPRRIQVHAPDGRPAIVKTYSNVDLKPRFDRYRFSCRIPKGAYWLDGTATKL